MVHHVQHQHSPGRHVEDADGKSNGAAQFDDRLLVNRGKGIVERGRDRAEKSDCRSKPECDQHEEEDDREKVAGREACQHLRVADESQSGRALYNVLHLLPRLVGEVAKDGKDDGAGQQGGEGVREADDEGVPPRGVAELVEGSIGGEGTKANAETEERLGDCGVPNLWLNQLFPFWREEESKTLENNFMIGCLNKILASVS